MRPDIAVMAVDALVERHGEYHYITKPDMRRMANAVLAEMEPPANVPGISQQRVVDAFTKVREARADKPRPRA